MTEINLVILTNLTIFGETTDCAPEFLPKLGVWRTMYMYVYIFLLPGWWQIIISVALTLGPSVIATLAWVSLSNVPLWHHFLHIKQTPYWISTNSLKLGMFTWQWQETLAKISWFLESQQYVLCLVVVTTLTKSSSSNHFRKQWKTNCNIFTMVFLLMILWCFFNCPWKHPSHI